MRSEVLKLPAFRRLWLGQAVSQFGDALYGLLFLFMVDKLTGEAAMVGIVGALESLPFLLLGPAAGAIADRVDRRRVMLTADVVSAVVLFAFSGLLLVSPRPPIALVFLVAVSLSLVNTFFAPAKSAAIPALVPADRLMEANALSSATQNLMPLIGLGLSGTLLGLLYKLYPAYFFFTAALVNALTFAFSALCLVRLPSLVPKREEGPKKGAMAEAWEGFRFLRADVVLLMTTLLDSLFSLFVAPFMVVYVAVNRAWFGGQFATLAICEASFMLALVVASLWLSKRQFRHPTQGLIWGLAASGLTVVAMAFSRPFYLFTFWNIICGLVVPFAFIPMETFVQLRVPDAYRGRVSAAMRMAQKGVSPLAMAGAGWLLDRLGLQTMFLIMGLGMSASALLGLCNRTFRTATMPDANANNTPNTLTVSSKSLPTIETAVSE